MFISSKTQYPKYKKNNEIRAVPDGLTYLSLKLKDSKRLILLSIAYKPLPIKYYGNIVVYYLSVVTMGSAKTCIGLRPFHEPTKYHRIHVL